MSQVFCCGHFDLSGVLLFTTAKSVITSTRGITAELDKLQETSDVDRVIKEESKEKPPKSNKTTPARSNNKFAETKEKGKEKSKWDCK